MALEDQLVVVGYRKVEASFKRVGDDLLEGVLMNFGELGFKESAFRGWGITGKEVDFAFIKQTFNIKIIKFQNKFILTVAKTILVKGLNIAAKFDSNSSAPFHTFIQQTK
jgi:hypothetical protein